MKMMRKLKLALIIILDDSSFARKATGKIVGAIGHDSIETDSEEACLEAIRRRSPDCVLIDLLMPDKNGIDIIKDMKEKGIDVPVIVQTADIQDSVREKCIDAGAALVLHKPPNRDSLAEAISKVLANA